MFCGTGVQDFCIRGMLLLTDHRVPGEQALSGADSVPCRDGSLKVHCADQIESGMVCGAAASTLGRTYSR